MARRSGKSRKLRRAMHGGGLGQSYSFGAPIVPGLGNSAEVLPMSSCLAATRPGMVSTPTTGLGLPGFSGGARRRGRRGSRGSRRSRRVRTQRGGRYSFDLSAPIAGGTPWGSGIPPVMRIPCEGSTPNPLNPGPHTPSTQPPMRGGASVAQDLAYYAPTAGYGNAPSGWVGSTGAPVLVQTPYDARAMNPACLKTGGGRRKRRSTHRRRR
jgi:hypothetical protein